ncbi:MAG: histidine phosphatase family protein [Giesbergeria sp.]|uniref:histidine phosphatase family protein n=1 Tax=Giesbergeria sp. TaxID=2818473 RepID=UPI0026377A96|nr:histidine phosphatase family protein [Giesbergeria sp.]MDD2609505.1 histidine phosphatase family protein [Giesbergeria sp.]
MQNTRTPYRFGPLLQPGLLRQLWCGLCVSLCLAGAGKALAADVQIPPPSDFRVIKAQRQHVQLLRQGGLVLYMRHGPTNARIPDQIPVKLDDCASQRPLTDAGRAQLDKIAGFVRQLRIPYQQVVSSPFCRAQESARRVFNGPIQIDPNLRYTAAMPEAEKKPAVARTRYWLSEKISTPRSNRIVVAHGPNMAELIDYLPPEASLVLFRPLGNGATPSFEYLASIEPGHWPELLATLDAL